MLKQTSKPTLFALTQKKKIFAKKKISYTNPKNPIFHAPRYYLFLRFFRYILIWLEYFALVKCGCKSSRSLSNHYFR